MHSATARLVVSALFGIVVLAGCSTSSEGGESVGPIRSELPLLPGEQRISEEDQQDSLAEIVNRFHLQEAEFTQCVNALGYEYEARQVRVDVDDGDPLTFFEFRREWGYGVSTYRDNPFGLNITISGGVSPIEDFDTFVFEDGEGDCFALYPLKNFEYELVRLRSPVVISERPLNSSEMVEATEQWSSCMKSAGFDYNSPDERARDLAGRFNDFLDDPNSGGSDEFRNEELRIAARDVECFVNHVLPVLEALQ